MIGDRSLCYCHNISRSYGFTYLLFCGLYCTCKNDRVCLRVFKKWSNTMKYIKGHLYTHSTYCILVSDINSNSCHTYSTYTPSNTHVRAGQKKSRDKSKYLIDNSMSTLSPFALCQPSVIDSAVIDYGFRWLFNGLCPK